MQTADDHLILHIGSFLSFLDLSRLKLTCSRFNALLVYWRQFSIKRNGSFVFSWYNSIDAWDVAKGRPNWFILFMEFKYPASRGWWSESWQTFFLDLARKIIKYGHLHRVEHVSHQVENVAYLIGRGLNVEEEQLLSVAVGRGNKEMVEYFLSLGVDVNRADRKLITPLHVAFYCNQLEIAQVLMEHKASTLAEDKHHRTPLEVAALVNKTPQVAGFVQLFIHSHTQNNYPTATEP